MMTIYTLMPGTIPGLDSIREALGESFKFVMVDKLEELAAYKDSAGAVLLGGDLSRVPSLVGVIRSTTPKLACVVALNPGDVDKLEPHALQDADVLVLPASPLEMQTRLSTAAHLSELRILIEEAVQMDEETHLYTNQYYLKRLGEEMALSRRHLSPLTCVIVGLSYFEVLLDSYGYQFITQAMQQIAGIIKEQVRKEDIVARLGDSEVALLLPRSTEKGALTLTKRIIEKIESVPLYMGDQIEHLHVNAGIAGFPMPDEETVEADTLVRFARHALHQAKCSETQNIQLLSDMKPQLN